jgi:SAM-dependent methyltransferase
MPFADGSFDVVHARSVLQHVSAPEKVIGELARVLAPGGVAYALVPLPTAPYAGSDARLWGPDQSRFEPWTYLRQPNQLMKGAYLNAIRLPDWQALFDAAMPGNEISLNYSPHRGALEEKARTLKEAGELREFSVNELLARSFELTWKKPG